MYDVNKRLCRQYDFVSVFLMAVQYSVPQNDRHNDGTNVLMMLTALSFRFISICGDSAGGGGFVVCDGPNSQSACRIRARDMWSLTP